MWQVPLILDSIDIEHLHHAEISIGQGCSKLNECSPAAVCVYLKHGEEFHLLLQIISHLETMRVCVLVNEKCVKYRKN